jgi:hypothetical protein
MPTVAKHNDKGVYEAPVKLTATKAIKRAFAHFEGCCEIHKAATFTIKDLRPIVVSLIKDVIPDYDVTEWQKKDRFENDVTIIAILVKICIENSTTCARHNKDNT